MSCAMLTQSRVRSASVVLAAVHMRKRDRLLFLRLRDASSRSIKGISPILDSPDLGEYEEKHKVAEVPRNINYTSTRTWRSKAISGGRGGVEVVGGAGEVLASIDFTIKARPGPSGP